MQTREIVDFYLHHHPHSYEDNQPGSNQRMAEFLIKQCAGRSVNVLNIGGASALPLEMILQKATSRKYRENRMAMAGVLLTSVDISMSSARRNVHQLRTNLAQRTSPSFSFQATSAEMRSLPFFSNGFDVVVSNLALDILPEPDRTGSFQEAHRVLRPGGVLYAHLHSMDMAESIRRQHGFRIDHYMSSEAQVLALMGSFQFSSVAIETFSVGESDAVDYFSVLAEK